MAANGYGERNDVSKIQQSFSTVTVIGAGLVGLYTALILAQREVDVTVFESGDDDVKLPKAAG